MSVRLKTLLLTASAVTALILALYVAARVIVLDSFAHLERESLARNLSRAKRAIDQEVATVDAICGDWAPWDDTYAFVQGKRPDYVEANLDDATIANLKLNLGAYLDRRGETVYAFGFDTRKGVKTALPDSILPHLAPGSRLLKHDTIHSKRAGLLVLPEGPMVVSSHPILNSAHQGPMAGTLVFGRWIDVERLSQDLRLDVSLRPVGSGTLSARQREVVQRLLGHADFEAHADDRTILGYSLLRDVYGNPALLLTIQMPRDIYRRGKQTLHYLLVSLLAVGLVSLAVVYVAIEYVVLLRLARLNAAVRRIGAAAQPGARVELAGKDELSELAGAINDMLSALEQAERTIRHQAYHDALTDLPNRSFFYERLAECLRTFPVSGGPLVAVLFLDLDHFKAINDTLGHAVGDQLLQEVAMRLRSCLRGDDLVARLGGDEFAVLLSRIARPDDAAVVAQKILMALRAPFRVGEYELATAGSLGIALYPKDAHTVDALLRNADIALYQAKEEGRDTYRFYATEVNTRALAHQALASALQEALPRGELVLHYQPQVRLQDMRVVGGEALVRWRHRDLGLLYPGQFLPVAEEAGLLVALGEWVLREACRECVQWRDLSPQPVSVSVNVSAGQFRDPILLDLVEAALKDSGLPGEFLRIEVSTAALIVDFNFSRWVVERLQRIGVGVVAEDAVPGPYFPNPLCELPLAGVKVDRVCLRTLRSDETDVEAGLAAMAEARRRGLPVIASGVETDQQLACLREHGCEIVQGYVISGAVPAPEFRKLLSEPVVLPNLTSAPM